MLNISVCMGQGLATGLRAGARRLERSPAASAEDGSAVATLAQGYGYDNLNRLTSASLNGAGNA